ncbi:MAG: AAA family ATPase, partial [Actinomycetota bacterium]|nr:AAA family ATPase [Actinomycetota bacterium]
MADCPNCGELYPPFARFCPGCGSPLVGHCAECGAALPADARFCSQCGAPKQAEAVPEMIKLVTIMFADIVGSTAQTEKMAPEDARALIADFFEAMSEEILAEGGTIERLVGDAIMADFGVPIAREDDARRAVRAARRMLARLERFNSERTDARRVQIRIGINTGEVSTGGTLGQQLMVMGDAVNVAARLQQIAQPGTIVVGERTARAVRDWFDLELLPPLVAKGKSESLTAFMVGAEHEERDRWQFPLPLVGRKVELDALRVTFDGVEREKNAHLIAIIGDPGVGKSRLIQEFIATLGDAAAVVAGRCVPYETGVALSPLREMLRIEAGLVVAETPEDALEKIVDLVRATVPSNLSPDPERVGAALAATIGIEPALSALGQLDPREVRRELIQAWRVLMTGLATQRPVVCVVEDLHWADEETLEVLNELARHVEGPVLFVCSARPEIVSSRAEWLAALPSHASVSLEPLDVDESMRLISSILGGGDLPPMLWERILAKAEGNPFFIEEVVRRLIEGAYLIPEDGRWIVARDVPEAEIPDNVQAVVLARLDLLDPRDKMVIQQASVVGRIFWSGAVEHLTGFDDVESVLHALERHRLVTKNLDSATDQQEYSFKHALIREVAYESIPRKARGEAHAATGVWIEEVRGDRAHEVAELLAHHYGRAFEILSSEKLRAKARTYCLLAANDAVRRFMVQRAAQFGERAVDLSVPGPERAEAREIFGDVSYMALRGEAAWESYRAAIEELGLDESGPNFVRLAAKATIIPTRWVGTMSYQPPDDEIEMLIDDGLDAAPASDSRDRALLLAARAFFQGAAVGETGDAAGEKAAREAIEMAERLDDPELLSAAMDALAVWWWPSGRWGEVARVGRARLELIPRLTEVREICDIALSAGRDLTLLGHYQDAVKYLSLAMDRARGVDTGQYLHAIVHRVYPRFMAGDWDGALEDQSEIERLETPTGGDPPRYAVRPFGVMFFLHALREETEEADRYLEVMRRFRAEIAGMSPDAWGPLAVPARTLAYRGEAEEAMAWLRLDRWRGRGEHLEAACEIVILLDDPDRCDEILDVARAEAEHGE